MTTTKNDFRGFEWESVIFCFIGNRQYCKGTAENGEKVTFGDPTTRTFKEGLLLVSNSRGTPIGFVGNGTAHYLRPLMEQGKIYLEGIIHEYTEDKTEPLLCHAEVFLTPKGKRIFRKKKPKTAEDVIHNQMVDIYVNKEKCAKEVILKLKEYYYPLIMHSSEISNETKLIYAMLGWKAFVTDDIIPYIKARKRKYEDAEEDERLSSQPLPPALQAKQDQ